MITILKNNIITDKLVFEAKDGDTPVVLCKTTIITSLTLIIFSHLIKVAKNSEFRLLLKMK